MVGLLTLGLLLTATAGPTLSGGLETPLVSPASPGHGALSSDRGSPDEREDASSRPAVAPCVAPCAVGIAGVGADPEGVAYDPALSELFVADSSSQPEAGLPANVSVISDKNDSLVTTINLWNGASGIVYDPTNQEVYVANGNASDVYAISTATNAIVANVTVGAAPVDVAYDPAQGEIFVANSGTNNVSVMEGATNRVVSNLPVGRTPSAVVYDPQQGEIFVADWGNANLSVISASTGQVVASLPVLPGPDALAFDSALDEVFVGENKSDTVQVVDPDPLAVTDTITVNAEVDALAYDPESNEVFASGWDIAALLAISDATDRVVASIPIGILPWGIAYDSGTGEVYVADYAYNSLTAIWDGHRPFVWSVVPEPQWIVVGTSVMFETDATGGEGPLSYAYRGLPSGCTSENLSSFSCTPRFVGVYNLTVFVNDSRGDAGRGLGTLTVYTVQLHEFTADPTFLPLGDNVSFVTDATGGIGALAYAYSDLPPGCASADLATLTCRPTAGGNFTVRVTVRDSEGNSNSSSTNVSVLAPHVAPTGPFGLSSFNEEVLIVDLVLAGQLLLIVVLYVRRVRTEDEETSADSAAPDTGSPGASDLPEGSSPPAAGPVDPARDSATEEPTGSPSAASEPAG